MRNLLKTIITSRLKIILSILTLVVLLGGLVVATYLIQTQKTFDVREKAAEPKIPISPFPTKQYNIVLIMTDDLDVGSLEVLLQQGYMKNLKEEIIQKGTIFTNSFVTNSLCCPSRATLLTGQYSHNHNVKTNVSLAELFGLPSGGVTAFDDDSTTRRVV